MVNLLSTLSFVKHMMVVEVALKSGIAVPLRDAGSGSLLLIIGPADKTIGTNLEISSNNLLVLKIIVEETKIFFVVVEK